MGYLLDLGAVVLLRALFAGYSRSPRLTRFGTQCSCLSASLTSTEQTRLTSMLTAAMRNDGAFGITWLISMGLIEWDRSPTSYDTVVRTRCKMLAMFTEYPSMR